MDRRLTAPGVLISFEGTDGVGKTTQIAKLQQWLTDERGVAATVWREPGGTALGEAIRELLLHRGEAPEATAELLLFAAARAELVQKEIRPRLQRGEVVLLDRYLDSSVAYQAFGRGVARQAVDAINRVAVDGIWPDRTIWLKGASHRVADRAADRFDSEDPRFVERVLAGYQRLVDEEPHRWWVVDADLPVARVFDAVRDAVLPLIVAQQERQQ